MEANIDGTGVAIIFCVTELLTGVCWLGSRLSSVCDRAVFRLSVLTRLSPVLLCYTADRAGRAADVTAGDSSL